MTTARLMAGTLLVAVVVYVVVEALRALVAHWRRIGEWIDHATCDRRGTGPAGTDSASSALHEAGEDAADAQTGAGADAVACDRAPAGGAR